MATPLQTIYDAFLAKVEADDWMLSNLKEVNGELSYSPELKEDLEAILDAAIVQFRYPRASLDYDGEYFKEDLGNDEIQVLANLMKLEWIRRCIATWDNIRQLYSDKDFSQANFLDKLNKTGEQVHDECRLLLDRYGRAENYKPSRIFGRLAGKQ